MCNNNSFDNGLLQLPGLILLNLLKNRASMHSDA